MFSGTKHEGVILIKIRIRRRCPAANSGDSRCICWQL